MDRSEETISVNDSLCQDEGISSNNIQECIVNKDIESEEAVEGIFRENKNNAVILISAKKDKSNPHSVIQIVQPKKSKKSKTKIVEPISRTKPNFVVRNLPFIGLFILLLKIFLDIYLNYRIKNKT